MGIVGEMGRISLLTHVYLLYVLIAVFLYVTCTRSSSYKWKHMRVHGQSIFIVELDNNIYKTRVSNQKKRVFLKIMILTSYKEPDLTDITILQSLTL